MSRSIAKNLKKKFFFSNSLPLQIWTLKICNHNISKTITARSFKLCQLIEDDEQINRGVSHYRFLPVSRDID